MMRSATVSHPPEPPVAVRVVWRATILKQSFRAQAPGECCDGETRVREGGTLSLGAPGMEPLILLPGWSSCLHIGQFVVFANTVSEASFFWIV